MAYVSSFEPRVVSRAHVQRFEPRARISPLKHLVSARDINSDDVDWFCEMAAAFESGRAVSGSTGKTVALLFFQASTLTRMGFEAAAVSLGCSTIGMED